LLAYETGELDVLITGLTYDAIAGETTLTLQAYGTADAVIDVEFNTGSAWLPATQSGTPSSGSTYIHAVRADLGDFDGAIQYRASIRRV